MKKTTYNAPSIKVRMIYTDSVLEIGSISFKVETDDDTSYGGIDNTDEGMHGDAKDDDFFWDSSIDE
jgi:hypothetical protein